nr:hypothetical protein [Azospirillum brasilense]
MSLVNVRQLCVDEFPLSSTRAPIMDGIENVINVLMSSGVRGRIWVDGSFMTQKVNPEDVDILLEISADNYDNGSYNVKRAADWVGSNLKETHLCDSYLLVSYPPGHQFHPEGQFVLAYWMRQFGFSRSDQMKGIGVVNLPEGVQ